MKPSEWKGIIGVPLTPFNSANEFIPGPLRDEVDFLIERKAAHIFSYPMHVAIKYATPLVIWGEPSTEYTAYYDYRDDEIEEVDETRFNRYVNLGITSADMKGMGTTCTALALLPRVR